MKNGINHLTYVKGVKECEVPVSEKHEKFKRLAESRVNKAICNVRSIAKLSNKSHYEYTDDEVKKIYSTLKGELDAMRDAFLRDAKAPKAFRL